LKIQFKKSFLKDVETLGNPAIKKRIRKAIIQAEEAPTLSQVENIKKLKGGENYYRIRVGDYRLGLILYEDRLIFVRCLHRKDIYRYIP
jgi:mRNA interferase RelE/StbE